MLLELIVLIHDMQNIEQLSLVLMQSLDLYIEDGVRIYINSIMILDILCQTDLVLVLYSTYLLLSLFIINKYLELAHL